MSLMKDLPEDSEVMKKIIEDDNPGYELDEVEKEYREDIAQWYFFCRMKLKPRKKGKEDCTGVTQRASPPP